MVMFGARYGRFLPFLLLHFLFFFFLFSFSLLQFATLHSFLSPPIPSHPIPSIPFPSPLSEPIATLALYYSLFYSSSISSSRLFASQANKINPRTKRKHNQGYHHFSISFYFVTVSSLFVDFIALSLVGLCRIDDCAFDLSMHPSQLVEWCYHALASLLSFLSSWLTWAHDLATATAHSYLIRILKCGPMPRHIAFIMDGNRRFATGIGLAQKREGHLFGYAKLEQASHLHPSPLPLSLSFFLSFSSLPLDSSSLICCPRHWNGALTWAFNAFQSMHLALTTTNVPRKK